MDTSILPTLCDKPSGCGPLAATGCIFKKCCKKWKKGKRCKKCPEI